MAGEIIVAIEKAFGATVIRAEFRLQDTEVSTTILFGPSGAGKTTVLRSIAGLERPDRGLIQFGEEVWFDSERKICRPPEARKVGMLFQQYALFPHLTVSQNVEYGLQNHSAAERHRLGKEVMTLFEIVDLAERRPSQISGGQAQRVALARALAPQPRILLLDEPLAALDSPTRLRLRTELRRFLERIRIPSIVVTHDRTEAISLGNRIVVMSDGAVQQTGSVDEVFRHPASSSVANTVGVETIVHGVVIAEQSGLATVRVDAGEIIAFSRDGIREQERVLACIRAEDVTLHRESRGIESARNHFAGTIQSIESDGVIERVSIDCGFCLVAMITRSSGEEMGLTAGLRVIASVKATAVHLVRL